MIYNVIQFLDLPPYTFEDEGEEDDSIEVEYLEEEDREEQDD